MIFFTADTHFDHENIIKYCNRPFKDLDDMHSTIIERWNRFVSYEDIVYHLGDFTLGGIDTFNKWACQLNGNIRIIPGSHDHNWLKQFKDTSRIKVIQPLVSIEIPEIKNGNFNQVIVLCHYSMQVWDRSHYGSWHLFGHSHGNLKGIGKSFDVGVDYNNFTPISLELVAEILGDIK